MCGRFAFYSPRQAVLDTFGVDPGADPVESYNRAPSQKSLSVRLTSEGVREATWLQWGLVPSWAKQPDIGNRMINARSETVAEKPSFRAAFRRRHCIVLADGFYEWQQLDGRRQPWFITTAGAGPFGFAGLWEHWDKAEKPLETFTILTTDACPALKDIHHRMPVVIAGEHASDWLDSERDPSEALNSVLERARKAAFECWPVSTRVNNPRHQGPDLVQPVET